MDVSLCSHLSQIKMGPAVQTIKCPSKTTSPTRLFLGTKQIENTNKQRALFIFTCSLSELHIKKIIKVTLFKENLHSPFKQLFLKDKSANFICCFICPKRWGCNHTAGHETLRLNGSVDNLQKSNKFKHECYCIFVSILQM